MAKFAHAMVTAPTYINGVLHLPGEIAHVNLTELGVTKLGQTKTVKNDHGEDIEIELTPGLKAVSASEAEDLVQVPVAAVAPHADNPTAPQGLPAGSRTSGTGRVLSPTAGDEDGQAAEMVPPAKLKADAKS